MIPQPCSRHLKRLLFNIDLGQADYDTARDAAICVTNKNKNNCWQFGGTGTGTNDIMELVWVESDI